MKRAVSVSLSLLTLLTLHFSAFSQSLSDAIDKQNYKLTEKIINKSPGEIGKLNSQGHHPLWQAAKENDVKAIEILLKAGADIHQKNKDGHPAIVASCVTNSYAATKILLENGADVNFTDLSIGNQKPIRLAAGANASLELIKLLVQYGADIESNSDDGTTPILIAVYRNNLAVAKYLFEQGAQLDYIARDGETIIHIAILTKNAEMVKLALKHGAPLSYKDAKGRTPLEAASLIGNPTIKKLIADAVKGK